MRSCEGSQPLRAPSPTGPSFWPCAFLAAHQWFMGPVPPLSCHQRPPPFPLLSSQDLFLLTWGCRQNRDRILGSPEWPEFLLQILFEKLEVSSGHQPMLDLQVPMPLSTMRASSTVAWLNLCTILLPCALLSTRSLRTCSLCATPVPAPLRRSRAPPPSLQPSVGTRPMGTQRQAALSWLERVGERATPLAPAWWPLSS